MDQLVSGWGPVFPNKMRIFKKGTGLRALWALSCFWVTKVLEDLFERILFIPFIQIPWFVYWLSSVENEADFFHSYELMEEKYFRGNYWWSCLFMIEPSKDRPISSRKKATWAKLIDEWKQVVITYKELWHMGRGSFQFTDARRVYREIHSVSLVRPLGMLAFILYSHCTHICSLCLYLPGFFPLLSRVD